MPYRPLQLTHAGELKWCTSSALQVLTAMRARPDLCVALERAVYEPQCDVAEANLPDMRHFIFKLNGVQPCTAARWGAPL